MSVAQSCPTLCDPMDCSPPGSSVQGILQARILEWVAIFLLQGIFLTQELNQDLLQETGIKSIPMEKKCKKAKWLSKEALQIAVKRSKKQRRKGKI